MLFLSPWYNLQYSLGKRWTLFQKSLECQLSPSEFSSVSQLDLIMEAIKKKMQSLKSETDNALQRAEELDKEAKEATQRAEKYEENVRDEEYFFSL